MSVAMYASINMELPISCVSGNCEVCAVICFLCAKGINAAEIHRRLCTVYNVDVMPSHTVHEWVHCFCDEKYANVHDEEIKRQKEATNEETKNAVLHILGDNQHVTLDEICERLADQHCIEISHKSIHRIVIQTGFQKVCMQWVPRLLIKEHRT